MAVPLGFAALLSSRHCAGLPWGGGIFMRHGPTTCGPLAAYSRQGLNLSGFQARTRGPVVHPGVCNFVLPFQVTWMVLEQPGCGRIHHRPGTLYVSVYYQSKLHPEKPSSVAGRVFVRPSWDVLQADKR